jgi:hypothetical protein
MIIGAAMKIALDKSFSWVARPATGAIISPSSMTCETSIKRLRRDWGRYVMADALGSGVFMVDMLLFHSG